MVIALYELMALMHALDLFNRLLQNTIQNNHYYIIISYSRQSTLRNNEHELNLRLDACHDLHAEADAMPTAAVNHLYVCDAPRADDDGSAPGRPCKMRDVQQWGRSQEQAIVLIWRLLVQDERVQ